MSQQRVSRLGFVTAAIVLALGSVPATAGQPPAAAQQPSPVPPLPALERTLVMPFDDPSGEGRIYWLREGASELLTADVRSAGGFAIGREERLRAFERLGVPRGASLSDATAIKLGHLLGASTVVVGTIALDGEQLRVRARSIRLDTGRIQADVAEQCAPPDLVRAFDRVAARLFPLLPLPQGHSEKDHPPLPAFENYVKGLVAEMPATRVKFLLAALDVYPGYDAARLALWRAYNEQGDHVRALAVAQQVESRSPVWVRARFLAGLSHLGLKQYDQAFAILRALTDEVPSAPVYNNIGVVQLRRGSPPPAGGSSYFFNKAREMDAADADYAFNLGYSYFFERDLQAAIYWLREAVRRNPADGEAHYVLGTALAAAGAATEGSREKELARRLSSEFAEWDRRPTAEPVPRGLERLKVDLQPAPPATGEFAFESAGQKDQQALARFHLEAGRRLFERENDRGATEELKRVVYLSPYQAEAHLLLGRIALRNGRVREAIDALKIALWSEETVEAHLALAEAYMQAKDIVSARAEAQRALALDPQSAEAKKLLDRLGSGR